MLRAPLSAGLNAAARWLTDHAPRVARVLRPGWRLVNRHLRLTSYWAQRRHFRYYEEVARLARVHAPAGRSVLDVGAADTQVLTRLDWFPRRVALDLRPAPPTRDVERVVADFLHYRPPDPFDLVLCLQVLEHLDEPAAFARKLLATGSVVIVSVPYRWPRGLNRAHVQDPVDEAKLAGWMGRPPIDSLVVPNGRERLVAVFRGAGPG